MLSWEGFLVLDRHWYSYSCVLPKWIQVIKIALLPERLILSKLYCSQPTLCCNSSSFDRCCNVDCCWPFLWDHMLLIERSPTIESGQRRGRGGTQDSHLCPPSFVPTKLTVVHPGQLAVGGTTRRVVVDVGPTWSLPGSGRGGSITKEDAPTWWGWAPPGRCRWMPRDVRYRTWGWKWRKKSKQIPQFEIRNLLIGRTRSDHQMTFRRLISPRSRLPTTTYDKMPRRRVLHY